MTTTTAGPNPPLLEQIHAARARLADHITRTPLVRSKRLEQDLNCASLLLKLECLQVTGSFKVRGAMNATLLAPPGDTLATASAGNHGLGLAYSAVRFGREPAVVYMPERTPLTKQQAIARYTSSIKLVGRSFEETKAVALRESAEHGQHFVHPYNDLSVIAGQGTLGLDIIDDVSEHHKAKPPDIVIIPVGGGGLIAGVATALKAAWPKVKIVAAEALNMPSLAAAMAAGAPRPITGTRTFADGIAVAEVGDLSFAVLKGVVDEVWKVSEESMAKAVVRLIEDVRVVAEGAGACGLGGLFDQHAAKAASISGKSVLIVVSGGNLDTIALNKLVQRAMLLEKRLTHIRFVAQDVPGALEFIARDIAELQVNILDIWLERMNAYLRVGTTLVDIIVETRDAAHVESLLNELRMRGHEAQIMTA